MTKNNLFKIYLHYLGLNLEALAGRQVQDFAGTTNDRFSSKTKCVLVAIYENHGKTILQPLIAEQEAKMIPELFQNRTLEVWLSNGKTDIAQFDIAILRYKQVLQSLAKCKKAKTRVCWKNYFKNLVSCEQCPLNVSAGETLDDES